MKVIECFHYGHLDDPLYHLNFKKYENLGKDCYLFMGDAYSEVFSDKYEDKEKIYLTLEEPNFCTDEFGVHASLLNPIGSTVSFGEIKKHAIANRVLTLCPYTAALDPKRTLVFFPFSEDNIPSNTDKVFDVIYTGSKPYNVNWEGVIETISKYNYRYVYQQSGYRVSDVNPNYNGKINLYAKSKIAITHGLATAYPEHVNRYKSYPNASLNDAFKCLDINLLPQFKSRVMEAAFSKCLIVNFKDAWNVIENWFTPNEEFLYFSNVNELDDIIKDVLANPQKYQSIIDKAHERAINNYTTKHFVEKYLM